MGADITNRNGVASGYYNSPWSCEDGGPERLQMPSGISGLNILATDQVKLVSRRLMMGNMVLLRDPGEVYLMHHDTLRRGLGFDCHSYIEKIDPQTLAPLKKSPKLAGGPFWPGGFAIHRNGDLYVTFGRYMHRLNPDCECINSLKLPQNLPYNSHVILDSGYLVTKPIAEDGQTQLLLIDSDTLTISHAIEMPEPSISRLSAVGNTVYVTGVTTIHRYHFNSASKTLERDSDWALNYLDNALQNPGQSYGWDPVIDQHNIWFMDNGKHTANKALSMLNEGVAPSPNNIIRVSVNDSSDFSITPISGMNGGSISNPPLYCSQRRILVAYDSANAFVKAWRHDVESNELTVLWQREDFGMAGHGLYFADSGELVTEDYRSLKTWRGLKNGEESVILDIETGEEKARFAMNNYVQSFCFSAPGFARDYYWLGLDKLTHVTFE